MLNFLYPQVFKLTPQVVYNKLDNSFKISSLITCRRYSLSGEFHELTCLLTLKEDLGYTFSQKIREVFPEIFTRHIVVEKIESPYDLLHHIYTIDTPNHITCFSKDKLIKKSPKDRF